MPRTKKQKHRPPTVEEMLQFKPKRLDFEWFTDEEGLVGLKVPKFKSRFGKYFCKLIKKDNKFAAKMDKIGSTVWQECDGKKSVKDILEILKKMLLI